MVGLGRCAVIQDNVAYAAFRDFQDEQDRALYEPCDEPLDVFDCSDGSDGSIAAGPAGAEDPKIRIPTVSEFLAVEDDPYDWLVPDVLERGDRLILTGPEGGGKSTLLRQLSVQLAAGIHPFGGEPFEPVRVLLLDVENSKRQVRRKLRPLFAAAKREQMPLYVAVRPQGLDLLQPRDRELLAGAIDAVRPDLIVGGPAYKLAGGDPTMEEPARVLAAWIDGMRAKYGLGLIMEAHSPYASGQQKRPLRPYGASLWSRWPEFGIHISADGELSHWRGPRDERAWPTALQRGGAWPWTVVSRERDLLWLRIKAKCADAGGRLSQRDLADVLETSAATVNRAIRDHKDEWDGLGATV